MKKKPEDKVKVLTVLHGGPLYGQVTEAAFNIGDKFLFHRFPYFKTEEKTWDDVGFCRYVVDGKDEKTGLRKAKFQGLD